MKLLKWLLGLFIPNTKKGKTVSKSKKVKGNRHDFTGMNNL